MPVRVPIETLRLQSVALEYLVKSRLKRATGRLSASAIDQLAPVTPEALIAWSAPALVGKPLVASDASIKLWRSTRLIFVFRPFAARNRQQLNVF